MVKLAYIFIFILFSTQVFSGTIHPEILDSKYVEYGKKFTYVYRLCGSYNDGKVFCASSVAIDPHFLLTAAHVVKDAKTCVVKDASGNDIHKAKEIIVNKDFEDRNFGFNDIAIIYVEDQLKIDFYPELYEDDDEVNKICSISGYGLNGTFETGCVKSDEYRRAGSNKIIRIENELLICDPSNHNRTELEFLIASGDSGGGLFIGNKLAGINSCVMAADKKPDSTYGDESGHTRVSIYKGWIRKIIERKRNEK